MTMTTTSTTGTAAAAAAAASMTSHHRDMAVYRMARLILLYTFLPLGAITWTKLKADWLWVLTSFAVVPLWVIVQSAVGVLTYRLYYADSPTPLTPRHGVVVVHPSDNKTSNNTNNSNTNSNNSNNNKDFLAPLTTSMSTTTNQVEKEEQVNQQSPSCSNERDFYDIPYETKLDHGEMKLLTQAAKHRPLRLLVIGDSLAIGVGQTHWPTPIMPETMAKTLSKKMGGRAVYWTCHGCSGASLGWVLRELERGVHYLHHHPHCRNEHDHNESSDNCDSGSDFVLVSDGLVMEGDKTITTTTTTSLTGDADCDHDTMKQWRQRLRQHRQRFEPNLQGFYDIAVVFTGPNDLKTAMLPFLFTGQDSHFRKQANFANDLLLLLDILRSKMKLQFQCLRESVETVTETVLETMEETVERFMTPAAGRQQQQQQQRHPRNEVPSPKSNHPPVNLQTLDTAAATVTTTMISTHAYTEELEEPHRRPLVVLPGMPSRMLPIFQHEPIRWYAPAAVDIMDMHKLDVACSLPDHILYIPPPGTSDLTNYILGKGLYHEQRQAEETILSLRDISMRDCAWQQQKMRSYYSAKAKSAYINNPFKAIRTRLFGFPPPLHLKGFAVDGIHPNELGYDFWGRYLANHILEAWEKRENGNV